MLQVNRPKHVTVPLKQHWHLATEMLDRAHPEIKLWENDELKIKYKTDGSRWTLAEFIYDMKPNTDLNLSGVFSIELQGLVALAICPSWL